MSNAKNGVGNKKWEGVGDAIIDLSIYENLKKLPKWVKVPKSIAPGGSMYSGHFFGSNYHLAKVRDKGLIPVKFKYERGKKVNDGVKGDEVEYYVAFLYFNYGIEKAKQFVVKNILNL